MSYTKLFSEIVTSTIWSEDDKTRIVWITMLATANKHGEVMASVPGLAKIATVSLEDTEKALDKLSSPDPYSRTPDEEGRRIVKIDGGWQLVNYERYRKKLDEEDRKRANAERQRRYRERQKRNASVTGSNESNDGVPNSNDKQKQKQKQKQKKDTPQPPKGGNGDLAKLAEEIYQHYPRKVGKPVALRAITKQLVKLTKEEEEEGAASEYLLVQTTLFKKARQGEEPSLTPHPSTWFNQERYNDDPSTWKDARPAKHNGRPGEVARANPPQEIIGDFS